MCQLNKAHGSKFPGTCTRERFDHRVHGEDAVTLAYGKKFNERGNGENSLMLSWEGKSAEVLRLALRMRNKRVRGKSLAFVEVAKHRGPGESLCS
jgi:hypothetical protein